MVSTSSSSSEVKIISECFVNPKTIAGKSKEPYHLSPLDHLMLSFQYIQKGLLFLKPSSEQHFMETLLQKLKDSLATTLVHFHPLAGRLKTLKTDHHPRSYSVFVDCNNSPGAGFIHAKSDLTVSDIVGSTYVPLVVQSFFDHHKTVGVDGQTLSVLSVKVTELVDGVFIGLSMNHSVGDGCSFWNFFNSWSEIFNSQEDDICLKNPQIFREVSGPMCMLPYSPLDESVIQSESLVLKERMFHFSSETVRSLKSMANQDCGTTTTMMISSLQSLTAFIWRSITRARRLSNDQETTCRFALGTRTRIDPPLPMNHFGVYTSLASTTAKTGELLENVLGWAASKLHQAVNEQSAEKIASELEQWLKSPFVLQPEQFSEPNLVHMGSSPRFDKYGSEFGMGKAVAVRSGYNSKHDGKVSAYPGREGGGSIDLEVCLLPEFMEALESDHEFMSLVSFS
ncbi:hypothetical protein N665_0002s0028 [Sinapis alba]|nr:hypothetical protein N665_0002s0028 [Sinapis alba]